MNLASPLPSNASGFIGDSPKNLPFAFLKANMKTYKQIPLFPIFNFP